MSRPAALGTALCACLLSFAVTALPASAGRRVFRPVAQHHGVLVFNLSGVEPALVRSAHLRAGERRAGVKAAKVRAAAGHGRLRVGAPRWAVARVKSAAATSTKLVIVTTCSTATSPYRSLVRASAGLVGYWRLDEQSRSAACDAQGATTGTYVGGFKLGAAGATGDGDHAVALNGSNAAVRAPSAARLNPRAAFSTEAWVRPSRLRDSQTVVRKDGQYLLRLAGRAIVFRVWAAGRVVELTSPDVLSTDRWQHIAATYDGSSAKIYYAGAEVASADGAGPLATTGNPLYLGASDSGGTYDWFAGSLDDVAIYAAALSPSAVAARVRAQRASTSDGSSPAGAGAKTSAGTKTGAGAKTGSGVSGTGGAPRPTAGCPSGSSWTDNWGTFGGDRAPGGCWRAYGDGSIFNSPISTGAATWAGSGAVVDWFDQQGTGPLDISLDYEGYKAPTYYGTASDPVYTLVHDPATAGYGPSNADGVRIHAPAGMRVHRDLDTLMSIVDQTTNTEYDFWYVTAIDDAARTITYKWAGQLPIDGSGVMDKHGYSYESGFGMQFGYIRYAELMTGEINHALYLCVPGVKGRVAPAVDTGGNFADKAGMPPMGGRLEMTLTDAQIDAVTLDGKPAPWYYKTILRAAAHYGMFVSDEGDSPWGGLRTESGLAYEARGQENPWKRFAREQDMGSDATLRFKDLRYAGQSVWRDIRVVAPSSYGFGDALL